MSWIPGEKEKELWWGMGEVGEASEAQQIGLSPQGQTLLTSNCYVGN